MAGDKFQLYLQKAQETRTCKNGIWERERCCCLAIFGFHHKLLLNSWFHFLCFFRVPLNDWLMLYLWLSCFFSFPSSRIAALSVYKCQLTLSKCLHNFPPFHPNSFFLAQTFPAFGWLNYQDTSSGGKSDQSGDFITATPWWDGTTSKSQIGHLCTLSCNGLPRPLCTVTVHP